MTTSHALSTSAMIGRLGFLAVAVSLNPSTATPQVPAGDALPVEVAREMALPSVGVSPVAIASLRDRVLASGFVAAVEEVQVQPLVDDQPIDALLADVGDRVAAGQVLARLSSATLDLQMSELAAQHRSALAAVAQAQAGLSEAQSNADETRRVAARSWRLEARGTIPRAQAEEAAATAAAAAARAQAAGQGIVSARAQVELLDAQVETLALQLARIEVRAPVAGLVVARNAQRGAIASASGDAMLILVREGAMEMRAEVPEGDLLRLAVGQGATLTSIGSAVALTGTVRLVEPSIDLQTRLGSVRIAIDVPSRVIAGMALTAEIVASEVETLAVPVTAVATNASGPTVMRVRDGLVERISITTGVRDGVQIGLVEGLSAGDLVVTKAAAFVRDGDRIEPVQEPAGAVGAPLLGDQS